jgi:hypothetical protein
MPFVTDSRFAGYLGPQPPLEGLPPRTDDAWENFLHDVFAGISGLPPDLVRPRWQEEPPLRPDISVNWLAFGTTATRVDPRPVFYHVDAGEGYDALQEMEELDVMLSFYGPQNEMYQSFMRRGLWVEQNLSVFRANAVALVSTTGFTRAAELVKERYWPRTDMTVTVRREIRYNYNVMNLISAQVAIRANPPGESRYLDHFVDTAKAVTVPLVMVANPQGVLGAGNGLALGVGATV